MDGRGELVGSLGAPPNVATTHSVRGGLPAVFKTGRYLPKNEGVARWKIELRSKNFENRDGITKSIPNDSKPLQMVSGVIPSHLLDIYQHSVPVSRFSKFSTFNSIFHLRYILKIWQNRPVLKSAGRPPRTERIVATLGGAPRDPTNSPRPLKQNPFLESVEFLPLKK